MGQLSFSDFVDATGSKHLTPLSNERIVELTGMRSVERLWKSTGTRARSILAQGSTPIDLAVEVTEKLFAKTGLSTDDIHALGLVHTCYDADTDIALRIATALGEHIGLARKNITAVSFGCAGFPEILSRVQKYKETLPSGKHILVVTSETPDTMIEPTDSRATPIFASMATATSLSAEDGHALLFAHTEMVDPPDNPESLPIFTIGKKRFKNFHGEEGGHSVFQMNGDLAYQNGYALIAKAAHASLAQVMSDPKYHGRKVFVVPHQPNGKMLKALEDFEAPEMMLKHPEYRIPSVSFINGMAEMGNTISSTIPSVFARWPELSAPQPQKGDIVLIPAAGICIAKPETKMSQGFGAIEW